MRAAIALCFLLLQLGQFALAEESQYFKSPDHWELTRGDQMDYIDARVEAYCSAKKIRRDSLVYACGKADSLTQIFKDRLWFKGDIGDTVAISLACNERESFQIAVLPLKGAAVEEVLLYPGELKNKEGQALPVSAISIYNVEYVKTIDSAYPVPFHGWWPDPLIPAKAVTVPPEETRAFWVEVRTAKDTTPGLYQGKLLLKAKNCPDTEISLSVQVWDFCLPSEQVVETYTWFADNFEPKYGKDRGVEMHRKYAAYLLDRKINPLDAGKKYFDAKDNYKTITETLAFTIARGQRKFEIPRLQGAELKAFCDYLRGKGWFDNAMMYAAKDEPHPRDYEAIRKDSAAIRAIEPKLKIFLAESPVPALYGSVDVWWSSMASDNPVCTKDRIAAGNEVWWYRCGIPVRAEFQRPYYEYPSDIVLDRPSIDMRIFYLMLWKSGMTPSTFFYAATYWPAGFDKWPETQLDLSKWQWNGDGYIVYPGTDGPWPSIRLQCLTDGIEDFEYLYLLKQELPKHNTQDSAATANARALLAVPAELVANTHVYGKAPADLQAFRQQVASAILSMRH